MVTAMAPIMGMKVRFTKSKLETPPIPEDTTITAVMGEQLRMMEAAKCMGSSISTGCRPVAEATAGVSAAKAKKGALPEPITMAEPPIIATITSIIAIGPKPRLWLPSIIALIVPMEMRPLAKV